MVETEGSGTLVTRVISLATIPPHVGGLDHDLVHDCQHHEYCRLLSGESVNLNEPQQYAKEWRPTCKKSPAGKYCCVALGGFRHSSFQCRVDRRVLNSVLDSLNS